MAGIAFDRKEHTYTIYNQYVHPRLERKLDLKNDSNLEKEQAEAQLLERYFNEIKSLIIEANSNVAQSSFNNVLTQEMINQLKSWGVFTYLKQGSSFRYDVANKGEEFEQDIAHIITTLFASAEGEEALASMTEDVVKKLDNTARSMVLGRESATIGSQGVERRFSAQQAKRFAQLAGKAIGDVFARTVDAHTGVPYYTLTHRGGVVDVDVSKGYTNINFDFGENRQLTDFFNILSTATFSAKNYLVSTIQERGITLGDTSDLRFFGSTLAFVGLQNDEIDSLWGRTKNYYKNPSRPGYNLVMSHIKHLRFAYELMGIGQSTGEAKFLIINQRELSGTVYNQLKREATKAARFIDTQRGDIKVFSNRWLIGAMFNSFVGTSGVGADVTRSSAKLVLT